MILPLALAAAIVSRPSLGTDTGACRPNESGPAVRIAVEGLNKRVGTLRAELYPDNDTDFLADDNVLLEQGKVFRRVIVPVPAAGPISICLRAPGPGIYSLTVIHNPQGGHGFSLLHDGVGFAGNPQGLRGKPHADQARIQIGQDITPARIVMNYLHGLFNFGPIKN